MQISLTSIPNSLESRNSLPRPDWSVVRDWVSANVANVDLNDAWTQLADDWVDQLISALPNGYSRTESQEFILLSNGDAPTADRILRWCDDSLETILKTLAGVARDEGYGKHVVFAFGDTDAYYDYVADFYPDEGQFALSSGMFLDRGYGHLAVCMAYAGEHHRTIAHELNHALLRHLPLPLWLNEGVTQVIEDLVVGSSDFFVDHETLRRHRDYWNSDTIHLFWSGDSFYSPDEGHELSYHLSQMLFRNLMSDYRNRIADVLNAANYLDAGNRALLDVCGVSLCDRVVQFLGDGEWSLRADYTEVDA
ncbi:MAG: hypothetical protein ABGX07_10355 [Pirellulaceae bacterium]